MIKISVIDSLVTDRTAADVAAGRAKGRYNAADLNRVGEAVAFLAERLLSEAGATVSVSVRTNWTMADVPSRVEMVGYLNSVNAVGGAVGAATVLPESMDFLDFRGANAIEAVLVEVDEAIERLRLGFVYSNEAFCGEF